MTLDILNQRLLPANSCFGCGDQNPGGLHIEIYQKMGEKQSLHGRFEPQAHMVGFPGILHGGILYTAMDCMAAWTASVLRPEPAIWILRSAQATYHAAAKQGMAVLLKGWLSDQGAPWRAVTASVEARDAEETLLAESTFKVIPLSESKFLQVAGMPSLPDNLRTFLSRGAG